MVTGVVEGASLLVFQRINWANWGHAAHVSSAILWIAPIWDVLLFVLAGVGVVLLGYVAPKLPAIRSAVFLFAFLMFFDWLATAERLTHRSALILALGLGTAVFRVYGKREANFLRFWKASLPWIATALILVWAGIQGAGRIAEKSATGKLPPASAGAPNIAVIVVDTLRADHLSSYGYERVTSPNIARVAEQGVLFENAIAASSWTLPSHASLLSGRFSYEHGATDVKPPSGQTLDSRYPTLAEVLSQHGYRTGAFSANYIYFSRDLGFGRGFIHFEDYFHSIFDSFSRTLYGKLCARFILPREKVRRLIIRLGFPSIDELQPLGNSSWMVRKRASEVNRETLNWIDGDTSKPFFVFMNYFDAHRPYGTPPGYPRKFVRLDTHALWRQEWDSPTPESRTVAYDEGVAYVDDQLGKFFDQLKQRGLDKNTLLIITSDHGDLLGEHGLYAHRNTLYRPLIRVPLVFWQPGHVPAKVRVQTPVSNSSLAATVTDMLGWTDAVFPGPSLTSLWSSRQSVPRWPDPLSELAQFKDESVKFPSHYGAMTSVITPQYHYITHQKFGAELYDWVQDPDEAINLAGTPAGKVVADSLAAQVQNSMAHPR
jgi:arylsulfatase A-like enzyme